MNKYTLAKEIKEDHELLKKFSKITSQLLINRGIHTLKDAEKFLTPKWEDNHDPFLLKDMDISIQRLYDAIKNDEKITIYADYDADGIPGAVILSSLFDMINYQHYDVYIPHRHDEGYGIHIDALKKIKKSGTHLIITIDVGITAHEAAEWCKENNIDLIITDHHLPIIGKNKEEELPNSFSLINPKQKVCTYPDTMLCGCGVIFKFIQAFIKRYKEEFTIPEGWEKWQLDMVSISTISDMVPLRGENRIFAHFGMKVIEKISTNGNKHRIGLKKLIWNSGINAKYITEEDISFNITPKINAASRMSHPEDAVFVFNAKDELSATHAVEHLTKLNNERKKLTKKTFNEAIKMLEEKDINDLIVVGNKNWKAGILGLVASKLVDTYKVPVFVWGQEGDMIKGSCRSLDGLHLVEMMAETKKGTFVHFGGHAEAGGFSCKPESIHELEKELKKSLKKFKTKNKDLKKDEILIDMVLPIDAISIHNYEEIRKLAPFGVGNAKPLFLFKNVLIEKINSFGKDKNHMEVFFKNSLGKTIKGITFFKTQNDFSKLQENKSCDILANIEYSVFMGKHELRLKIIDIL